MEFDPLNIPPPVPDRFGQWKEDVEQALRDHGSACTDLAKLALELTQQVKAQADLIEQLHQRVQDLEDDLDQRMP